MNDVNLSENEKPKNKQLFASISHHFLVKEKNILIHFREDINFDAEQ